MTPNFIFFCCGAIILHLVIGMFNDYKHFMNRENYYEKQRDVCKGKEYEDFLTELESTLNNRSICTMNDYELE